MVIGIPVGLFSFSCAINGSERLLRLGQSGGRGGHGHSDEVIQIVAYAVYDKGSREENVFILRLVIYILRSGPWAFLVVHHTPWFDWGFPNTTISSAL